MSDIPALVYFSSVIIKLVRWLDKNFDRLMIALRESCPDAPEFWIVDQVVALAFENPFGE